MPTNNTQVPTAQAPRPPKIAATETNTNNNKAARTTRTNQVHTTVPPKEA